VLGEGRAAGVACEVTGGLEAADGVEQLSGVLVELAGRRAAGPGAGGGGSRSARAASSTKNDLESACVCSGRKGGERPRGKREDSRNFE
jgi:hypothetical protein